MSWHLEAWDLPGVGTTKREFQIPAISAAGKRILSNVGSGRFAMLSSELTDEILANIINPQQSLSRLLRIVVDGDEAIPFFAERAEQDLDEEARVVVKVSGPGIEKGLEHGAIWPWDIVEDSLTPASKTLFPHWIWGGQEILQNGNFEDGREVVDTDPDSATFGEGTGVFKATGWEPSPHGALATNGFELITGGAQMAGTYSLKVNPLDASDIGRYAGPQQVVTVQPGGLYQLSLQAETSDPTPRTWRLVVRDIDENLIPTDEVNDWHEQTLAVVDGVKTWTLTNIRIPRNVDQVIARLGFVDASGNPTPISVDSATMTEGYAPASPGEILTALVAAIKARGVLTWLDTSSWSNSQDSAGNAWDSTTESVTFNAGENLFQALQKFVALGYEWTITGDVETGYALEVYNGGAAGAAIAGHKDLKAGIDILKSTIIKGIPTKNSVLVVGEGGVWNSAGNASDQSSYGEREKVIIDRDIASTSAASDRAESDMDLQDAHAFGIKIKVRHNESLKPFAATDGLALGDELGIDLTPVLAKADYRVHAISGKFTSEVPEWDYDLNRPVYTERESLAELLRRSHALSTAISRTVKEPKAWSSSGKVGFSGGVAGSPSSSLPGTVLDTDPPSQPKAPTVDAQLSGFRITHALGIQGGSDYKLETDIRYMRVYASKTSGFTPAAGDLVLTLPLRRTNFTLDIPVSGSFLVDPGDLGPWYVVVTAVDGSGNESDPSPETTGHVARLSEFYNGSFQEPFDATVTSDGVTVTLSLEQTGGGDLTQRFSDEYTILDCTPAKTVALTAGSDPSPTLNYVYILQSAKTTLAVSTSDWPAVEHIRVAKVFVPSAGFVQSDGAYSNQNINDHAAGTDGQGHASHIANRIREEGAKWKAGLAGAGVDDYLTTVTTTTDLKIGSGTVFQLHPQAVPAFDTSAGDKALVVNWNGDAYHDITNLQDIVNDSAGNAISNNQYFTFVVIRGASKTGEYSATMINLPADTYATSDDAINDPDGHIEYAIPAAFGTSAVLVAAVTVQKKPSTWTYISTRDLRGLTPSVAAAGGSSGGSGGGTDFADNVFTIHDETDITKIGQFQISGVTTGTTRTLTWPDANGTIELEGHTHVEADVTDLDHLDPEAIHDNVAGEITAVALKATPVSADVLLLEDSAAAFAKKRATVGTLPFEASGAIATHAGDVDAHHTRYTDAEADVRAALQDHDHATPIATHAAIAAAHHSRYTDAEAAAKIALDDLYVKIAGDVLAGNLNMDGNSLTNVGTVQSGPAANLVLEIQDNNQAVDIIDDLGSLVARFSELGHTFYVDLNLTGDVQIDQASPAIVLDRDTQAGGTSQVQFSTAGVLRGRVGMASVSTDAMYLTSYDGDIFIQAIRASAAAANFSIYADDASGTAQPRVIVDGDGATAFYDDAGALKLTVQSAGVNIAGSVLYSPLDPTAGNHVGDRDYNDARYALAGAVSPLTTKGDLFGFSTVDARIPVGVVDSVLQPDTGAAAGVSWTDTPTLDGLTIGSAGLSIDNEAELYFEAAGAGSLYAEMNTAEIFGIKDWDGAGSVNERLRIYHRNHATHPYDVELLDDAGNVVLQWDNSFDAFEFHRAMQVRNSFGDQAGVIEAFDTTGRDLLIISASTGVDIRDGVSWRLYGPGDSSVPGDAYLYAENGDPIFVWDESDDEAEYRKDLRITTAATLKAESGDNEVQNVSTVNGWATYFTAFGCWKDAAGGVHLRGMLRNGTATTIGTLPVGFRPLGSTQIFTVHETATGTARRIDITTAGVVSFSGTYPAAGVWFDLAGIAFYAGW